MPITISVGLEGLDDFRAFLGFVRDQVPFSTAKALTRTAQDAKTRTTNALDIHIDRPTPFTKNAVGLEWATKNKLRSRIFIKDLQAEYLKYAVEGGVRLPKNIAIVIPWNVRLNQYGNLTRTKIRDLLAKPNVFSGKIGGVGGIWERTSSRLILRVAYEQSAKYQTIYPFADIGAAEGVRVWKDHFNVALNEALKLTT